MNTDQCHLLGTLRHQAGIGTHTAIVTVTDTGHRHEHRQARNYNGRQMKDTGREVENSNLSSLLIKSIPGRSADLSFLKPQCILVPLLSLMHLHDAGIHKIPWSLCF